VLEIHLWGSTRKALEQPDRVIFDLDPDEGLAWERVTEGALAVRDLLAEMGLETFVKTTGGKGLHVVLPLRPKYAWDEIKSFAHAVANEIVQRQPQSFTGSLPKKFRKGKIFVDYLRNQRGATAIAPFSARARPGAMVAAPVTWKEVEDGIRGDAFTIVSLPQRLKRLRRDPWQGLLQVKQQIPAAAMKKLRP
jgi:bifunctional non-homologous end joining protein LigD